MPQARATASHGAWRRRTGRDGEDLAARHLTQLGYRIVARNFRCRAGEIDLIAEEGGDLVFIEVRARRSRRFGTAAESVTPRKQRQVCRVALHFLARFGWHSNCRFDVVTVEYGPQGPEIAVVRAAFPFSGP